MWEKVKLSTKQLKAAVGSVIDDIGSNKQLKQLHTAIIKGNEDSACSSTHHIVVCLLPVESP